MRQVSIGAAMFSFAILCSASLLAAGQVAVITWIECDDCGKEAEMFSALSPADFGFLGRLIGEGPPSEVRDQYRQHLEEAYDAIVAYNNRYPQDWTLPLSREEYVSMYLKGQDLRYRLRALEALRRLDPKVAITALRDAVKKNHIGSDVLVRLKGLLKELEGQ